MHLLIACAGSGRRMGAERNKLLLEVAGRPVLAWTLEAALASASIRWIGIVGQPIDQADILAMVEAANPQKRWRGFKGGTPARIRCATVWRRCRPMPVPC